MFLPRTAKWTARTSTTPFALNNASRGGLLENFYFRNINIGEVAHAIVTIDFNYEEGAKGKFTPVMRNFSVDNLTSGKSQFGVDIQGLEMCRFTT